MTKTRFTLCGADGHARTYDAIRATDGKIIVRFGSVVLEHPSQTHLAAAAIALQQPVPGLNTAEVVDYGDHK